MDQRRAQGVCVGVEAELTALGAPHVTLAFSTPSRAPTGPPPLMEASAAHPKYSGRSSTL